MDNPTNSSLTDSKHGRKPTLCVSGSTKFSDLQDICFGEFVTHMLLTPLCLFRVRILSITQSSRRSALDPHISVIFSSGPIPEVRGFDTRSVVTRVAGFTLFGEVPMGEIKRDAVGPLLQFSLVDEVDDSVPILVAPPIPDLTPRKCNILFGSAQQIFECLNTSIFSSHVTLLHPNHGGN